MVDEIKATSSSFSTVPVGRLGSYARGENASSTQKTSNTDRVEISELARLTAKYNEMPQIRTNLVDNLRTHILAGKYETQDKFDLAIDNLFDDITLEF